MRVSVRVTKSRLPIFEFEVEKLEASLASVVDIFMRADQEHDTFTTQFSIDIERPVLSAASKRKGKGSDT
jgi:hypothetical protein